MGLFLTLAYLFFLGSAFGWVLELVFRRFFSTENPEHKWINPGFCVGPYVPLYGFGICILYLLAAFGSRHGISGIGDTILLIVAMTLCMTAIEYIAGICCLKFFKIRLWDYSNLWGNIQGLICPLFSLFWAIASMVYYFCIHPYILSALVWLSQNLAFSFVIGFFFGVFTIDVAYSTNLVMRIKQYTEENQIIIKYERLKAHMQDRRKERKEKAHFFLSFQSSRPLIEHLKLFHERWEKELNATTKKK